jgi:hypothetical protein
MAVHRRKKRRKEQVNMYSFFHRFLLIIMAHTIRFFYSKEVEITFFITNKILTFIFSKTKIVINNHFVRVFDSTSFLQRIINRRNFIFTFNPALEVLTSVILLQKQRSFFFLILVLSKRWVCLYHH